MAAAACVSYRSPLGHGWGDVEEEQCEAEAESQKNTPTNRIWQTHGSPFYSRTPKNIYRLSASPDSSILMFSSSKLSSVWQDPIFRRKGVKARIYLFYGDLYRIGEN